MRLGPGSRLADFEILAPLGAGGMGEVYEARDRRLERAVAIKVLPGPFAQDPRRLARFRREARLLASLNHPNIATIHELAHSDGVNFLVMELVPGETLAGRLRRGAVPPGQALALFAQIAAGLDAAHQKAVVHRDLKPANIKVTPDGKVKILDFGLAKAMAPEWADAQHSESATLSGPPTAAGTALGTAPYMSPEQARGLFVDQRSDLWAFGCCLFEALTGRPAFLRETAADTIAAVLGHEPDLERLPVETPPGVRALLRSCLQKDEGRRLRDAGQARSRIEEALRRPGHASEDWTGARGKQPSIVVLPFVNRTADPEQEYFCDGIAEDISSALSHIESLRVIAPSSTAAFKGQSVDVRAIGRALDASSILCGSLRRSGSRLRITAQLTDVRDLSQLWSGRYDREMEDIFEVQDEISLAIAAKLKIRLLREEETQVRKKGTHDVEAYKLFLLGQHHQSFWTEKDIEISKDYFRRALEKDPEYALAYAGLAYSHVQSGNYGRSFPKEAYPKAREYVSRAIEIDGQIAEAHVTRAEILRDYEWDWAGAEHHYRRALEINPGCFQGHVAYAHFLSLFGRAEECSREIERALDIDPVSYGSYMVNGWSYYGAGVHEKAIELLGRAAKLDPDLHFPYSGLGLAFVERGDLDKARELAHRSRSVEAMLPIHLGFSGCLFGLAGEDAEARSCLKELSGRSQESYASGAMAQIYAGLGELDEAFRCLEKAKEERSKVLIYLQWPCFKNLRGDRRYQALLEELGFESAYPRPSGSSAPIP